MNLKDALDLLMNCSLAHSLHLQAKGVLKVHDTTNA